MCGKYAPECGESVATCERRSATALHNPMWRSSRYFASNILCESQGSGSGLRWLMVAAGGSLALTYAFGKESGLLQIAHGESRPQEPPEESHVVAGRLRDWLKAQGADMGMVEVKESKVS